MAQRYLAAPRSLPSVRRASVAATVSVLAISSIALIAGCGGGDGEELTREELIAQGDEICKQGRQQFVELQKDPPQSAAESAELTRQLIEITEEEIDDLRDLNAPAESQQALEEYLEAREAGLEILETGLQAAEDEDATAYAEAQAQIARSQVDRARLAERVGFKECSRPLSDADQSASGA
jgi:hypothetical protein